jgi:putative addiction module killer protein
MEVRRTAVFSDWLDGLKDRQARARILKRLLRVEEGNFGDHGGVGEGVMELRLQFGPGYRVYYVERSSALIILLAGGAKDSQARDIEKAKELARGLAGNQGN